MGKREEGRGGARAWVFALLQIAAKPLGALRSAAYLAQVMFLMLLVAPAARAQIEQCNDRNPAGQLECTYRPHIIEPWRYSAGNGVVGSNTHLDEESAKEEFKAKMLQACPSCCNMTITGEGSWIEGTASGNMIWAWLPDVSGGSHKTLTYRLSYRDTAQGTCGPPQQEHGASVVRWRYAWCERGAWSQGSAPGQSFCYRARRCRECRVGHPIALPSKSKVFTETDYRSPIAGGLMFVRDYRSDGYSYPASFTANLWGGLGNTWTHNYAGYLSSTPQSIWVSMGAAPPLHFAVGNGSTFPRVLSPIRPDTRSKLVETLLGEFAYYTEQNDLIVFRGGVPVGIYAASGWGVELTYAANRLNLARETSGRTLQFGYSEDEHLTSVVDPAGQVITYRFKNRLLDSKARPIDDPAYTTLTGVVFQDQKTREYQVPDWSSNGTTASFATRIHGVVDELGAQYETVTYDSNGFATSSELAGGVDRYQVGSGVTDPLGTRRTYQFDAAAASPSSLSQPAGSGSAAAITSVGYDANGNVASRTDFNGSATCYGNDLTRNIETVRVEGLTSATACSSYTAAGASLPTGARKVSMQWHPEWRLPTRVAEPGRITTHVYNGQPDPFAAGAVASCAPTAALLPDGKPIAVRCRQVDQATTDGNGSQGFTATVQAGVANREQKWTYNQYGQVLTHDGPRVDVSDVTTYAYYSDTSYTGTGADAVGHTTGDLQSITDAAGQITRFTKYNKHGLLLESIDANGVVTSNTYDLRLRLLSSTVAGQTTSYSYDAAGQLLRITWPDASYIGYEYDPAHRQTAVFDNLGNRIEYMLDNAGNRIAEIVKDPSGALARTLSRSIDALGRVQQGTGRQ